MIYISCDFNQRMFCVRKKKKRKYLSKEIEYELVMRESEKFCVIEWKWDCGVRHKRQQQQQQPKPFRPIYDALHFVWHAENLNDSEGNCFFGVDLPPRSCFGRPRSVRILCRMISWCEHTFAHRSTHICVSIYIWLCLVRVCAC